MYLDEIGSEYRFRFPSSAVDDALSRTSDAAEESQRVFPIPEAEVATRETEEDPADLSLELLLEMPNVTAVSEVRSDVAWVAQLEGTLSLIDLSDGTVHREVDLSDDIQTGSEQGLLSLAFQAEADRLFISFSNSSGDTQIDSFATAVGSGAVTDRQTHFVVGQPFDDCDDP